MNKQTYRFRVSTKKVGTATYQYLQLVHRTRMPLYRHASSVEVITLYPTLGNEREIKNLSSSLDTTVRRLYSQDE